MAKTKLKKNADGYGYKYANMAAVNEYIEDIHGKYYQYTKTDDRDGYTYVWTHRFADDLLEEDIDVRGARVVDATLSNGKQNPAQANGSALTYARRYSLYMAYGLAVEDNDAEDLTYEPEMQPASYHDQLVQFANMNGILLEDVAAQYDLHPGDSEDHYRQALEQMKRDMR